MERIRAAKTFCASSILSKTAAQSLPSAMPKRLQGAAESQVQPLPGAGISDRKGAEDGRGGGAAGVFADVGERSGAEVGGRLQTAGC